MMALKELHSVRALDLLTLFSWSMTSLLRKSHIFVAQKSDEISMKSMQQSIGVHQNVMKWKFYYLWQVQRYGLKVLCLQWTSPLSWSLDTWCLSVGLNSIEYSLCRLKLCLILGVHVRLCSMPSSHDFPIKVNSLKLFEPCHANTCPEALVGVIRYTKRRSWLDKKVTCLSFVFNQGLFHLRSWGGVFPMSVVLEILSQHY